MHLRFCLDENGKRVYTIKMENEEGQYTLNAHPARFSPDDKFSAERLKLKQRFNLLPIQQPDRPL